MRPRRTLCKTAIAVGLPLGLMACSDFHDPTLGARYDASTGPQLPVKEAIATNPSRNLLWGDLHVHTALSYDAFTMGIRALPDDAYTYMKGGTIQHALGYPIRADRPLDSGAVTDHAEYLGIPRHLAGEARDKPDAVMLAALESGSALRFTATYLYRLLTTMGSRETREENLGRPDLQHVSVSAWQDIQAAAERHNEPGVFTTFVAYEYSSMPNARNLHRNVIYKSQ